MSLAFNPALSDLPVYQPGRPIEEVAREVGLPPQDIIKLASNENPLGPSPAALVAMEKALKQLHLYPDGNAFYLKNKLAEKLGVEPDGRLEGGDGAVEIAFGVQCGPQVAVRRGVVGAESNGLPESGHGAVQYKWTQASKGTQTAAEYDATVRDVVNFLAYVAEPSGIERRPIGIVVLFVLGVLFVFAYLLKKEYWKDVK